MKRITFAGVGFLALAMLARPASGQLITLDTPAGKPAAAADKGWSPEYRAMLAKEAARQKAARAAKRAAVAPVAPARPVQVGPSIYDVEGRHARQVQAINDYNRFVR